MGDGWTRECDPVGFPGPLSDHGILLDHLVETGSAYTLFFPSFLGGWTQMVVLRGCCPPLGPVAYGAPWGSILSPTLFNTCMKLLGGVIWISCAAQSAMGSLTYLHLTLGQQWKSSAGTQGLDI